LGRGELGSLDVTQKVNLNASGYGIVKFVPNNSNWTIESITVTVALANNTAPVLQSVCRVYKGASLYVGNSIDTTSTGNGDVSTGLSIQVRDQEWLQIEWTGGDVGAIATARIIGSRTVYGKGFRAASVYGGQR